MTTTTRIFGENPSISLIYSFIESAQRIRRKCKSEFCRSITIDEKIRGLKHDPVIQAIAEIYAIYLAFGHIDYITVGIVGDPPLVLVEFLSLYPGVNFVYIVDGMTYHKLDVIYYSRESPRIMFDRDLSYRTIYMGYSWSQEGGLRMNHDEWIENMNYLLGGMGEENWVAV